MPVSHWLTNTFMMETCLESIGAHGRAEGAPQRRALPHVALDTPEALVVILGNGSVSIHWTSIDEGD